MISQRRGKGQGRTAPALLTAAALLLALPQARALAADWPEEILRGTFTSEPAVRWDGLSIGAQIGVSNLNTDFGNSTSSLIAYSLRNQTVQDQYQPSAWTTLPANTTNGQQYGAFLGYTMQWDQLVLGVDAAYNRPSTLESSASDTIARQVVTQPDNINHGLTITARSTLKMVDYATMRVRAGYAVGQFLPFATVGAAVGRFNYTNTATIHHVGTPPGGSPIMPWDTTDVQSNSKNNAIVGGFTFGLGMDVAILPNVFLRGEWEFAAFAPVGGIRPAMNTGRVALGVRF
jgi:opacity protein-like surface antigen